MWERLSKAFMGLSQMPVLKQTLLLVALAASIALGGAVAMWSQSPRYALLYGGLNLKELPQVLAVLEGMGIPYEISRESGAVLVPSSRVAEARLELAGADLPKSTASVIEVLETEKYGISDFGRRKRYQHALEGELAQTIASLNAVDTARVHLALPRESSLLRNRQMPSASVVLGLMPGRILEEGQSRAIAHLVAAAITNLEPNRVRVLDGNGMMLTAEADGMGLSTQQLGYVRQRERQFVDRIERALAPFIGVDGVRAEITAEYDFTRTERSRESYQPDLSALRSERTVESLDENATPAGVPGALTNQPPGTATVPEQAPGDLGLENPQEEGQSRRHREAIRNYELDRVVSHTEVPSGRLIRLSAAVMIDHARSAAADGTSAQARPRTPEEMDQIREIAMAAIGFSEARGDRLYVTNTAFVREVVEVPQPTPWWQSQWLWNLARQAGAALLVLLLVLGVLRPMTRNLSDRHDLETQLAQLPAPVMMESGPAAAEGQVAMLGASAPTAMLPGVGASSQDQLNTARGLVVEDPKRVANVVKDWLGDG